MSLVGALSGLTQRSDLSELSICKGRQDLCQYPPGYHEAQDEAAQTEPEFNFPKLIAYYNKVLAGCLDSGGKDWRWELYLERLRRIVELSTKNHLSQSERDYLAARQAVALR